MCFLSGPSMIVEIANSRMLALWGNPPEDVINTPLFNSLPEARRPGLQALASKVYNSGKLGVASERPVVLQRADGVETRYVDFICDASRAADGSVRGVMIVAIDVTGQVLARRKVEVNEGELLKRVKQGTADLEEQKALIDSILKNSPVGITVYKVIRDPDGKPVDFRCILTNDASAELTGIPLTERYTKTVLETIPGFEQTATFKMAIAAIEKGTSFRTEYYYAPAKKWLELAVVKIYEDHLINVFRDITEIKEAQLLLESHIEKLQRMNADLSHFTYAASHDMKEPLRKVLIFCDRLGESLASQLNPEQRHYLERIESATRRMNFLIDDLLTYHEVSGKSPVKEWVDLNRLILEVLDDLDLEIEEKQARISVGPLLRLHGHPRQLQQVFHNLIGNALKYGKPDVPPEVKIECRKLKGSATGLRLLPRQLQQMYIMLSISDNGIGFDPDDAQRIFNVFERLHQKTHEGTGLGLPIVRRVVENHNGFVVAEGAPGIGATFKLFFSEDVTQGQPEQEN